MSSKIWLNTTEAAIALDLPAKKLRTLCQSGMFKVGHHYRDVSPPGSKRPTLQFHVNRCQEQLNTPPEKRKSY
ncbi:DNA-binding protein [Cyanobacteria bacterium FACHB-63]|nr:DNA-binding protein [Cyanobacteria bacterium FACHB-63]